MGLFAKSSPPNLPVAPAEYSQPYMNALSNALRLFFNNISATQNISVAGINAATLPTEASLATLRVGDVYRDSAAGNVLKVKV